MFYLVCLSLLIQHVDSLTSPAQQQSAHRRPQISGPEGVSFQHGKEVEVAVGWV